MNPWFRRWSSSFQKSSYLSSAKVKSRTRLGFSHNSNCWGESMAD